MIWPIYKKRIRKCYVTCIILLMAFTAHALAAGQLDADDIEVYIGNDEIEAADDDESKYKVQSNVVDIVVDNFPSANNVTINGIEAEPDGRDWVLEDVELSPGENTITVSVDGSSVDIVIDYVDVAAPNSCYRINDITKEMGEDVVIEAFQGSLKLDLGKNVLLDDGRDEIADEQSIEVGIYEDEYIKSRFNFVPASKLYKISAADEDYTLLHDGRLTITYDVKDVGSSLDTLTVLWFKEYDDDPNWSVFENLGGKVDRENNSITVTFPKNGFGYYGVFNVAGNFSDFYVGKDNVRWAQTYVLPLYAKGIMQPLDPHSGYFGLVTWDGQEKLITQGEFATMLAKALQLPYREIKEVNHDYSFGSNYYTTSRDPYVEASASHGFLRGIPFSPNSFLTREQAAVMIAQAADLRLYNDLDLISRIVSRIYTDSECISPWARPHVYAVYRTDLMIGMKDPKYRNRYKFAPQSPLTRAQAAKIVYKLMQMKNIQDEN